MAVVKGHHKHARACPFAGPAMREQQTTFWIALQIAAGMCRTSSCRGARPQDGACLFSGGTCKAVPAAVHCSCSL